MEKYQADEIIRLLQDIKQKLDNISDKSDRVANNTDCLDDIKQIVRGIKEDIEEK